MSKCFYLKKPKVIEHESPCNYNVTEPSYAFFFFKIIFVLKQSEESGTLLSSPGPLLIHAVFYVLVLSSSPSSITNIPAVFSRSSHKKQIESLHSIK